MTTSTAPSASPAIPSSVTPIATSSSPPISSLPSVPHGWPPLGCGRHCPGRLRQSLLVRGNPPPCRARQQPPRILLDRLFRVHSRPLPRQYPAARRWPHRLG